MKHNFKKMDIKVFRELGYLQELNRQFLHPLGLALEVTIEEDGAEKLSGIWDCQNDKEGIYYDLKNSNKEKIEKFKEKAEYIEAERDNKLKIRKESLGFIIEPI